MTKEIQSLGERRLSITLTNEMVEIGVITTGALNAAVKWLEHHYPVVATYTRKLGGYEITCIAKQKTDQEHITRGLNEVQGKLIDSEF